MEPENLIGEQRIPLHANQSIEILIRHAQQGMGMLKIGHVAPSLRGALCQQHGSRNFSSVRIHPDCTEEYPWKRPSPLMPYTSALPPCDGCVVAKTVRIPLPINQHRNRVWHHLAHGNQTK